MSIDTINETLFESIKHVNEYGQEYWTARELMTALGYKQWRRFSEAIERAKTSCEASDNRVSNHFADAGKTIEMPKGAVREIPDFHRWNVGKSERHTKEARSVMTADEILDIVKGAITGWHEENEGKTERVILTDEMRRIKPMNEHRGDLSLVVRELALTNTEIWHEEDKLREPDDAVVVKACRNVNHLNQHRNDLMEEIDEIIADEAKR